MLTNNQTQQWISVWNYFDSIIHTCQQPDVIGRLDYNDYNEVWCHTKGHSHSMLFVIANIGEGEWAFSFVTCLRRSTTDYSSLARRSRRNISHIFILTRMTQKKLRRFQAEQKSARKANQDNQASSAMYACAANAPTQETLQAPPALSPDHRCTRINLRNTWKSKTVLSDVDRINFHSKATKYTIFLKTTNEREERQISS